MSKILKMKLQELNISISDRQEEQFEQFYDLLIEWNKVMNLTGITEYEEVVEKHFVDSLSLVKAIEIDKIHSVIDIGTGAGFPGRGCPTAPALTSTFCD